MHSHTGTHMGLPVHLFAGRTTLDQCGEDLFWFFCLPLKHLNADGAPIRAIAFWES